MTCPLLAIINWRPLGCDPACDASARIFRRSKLSLPAISTSRRGNQWPKSWWNAWGCCHSGFYHSKSTKQKQFGYQWINSKESQGIVFLKNHVLSWTSMPVRIFSNHIGGRQQTWWLLDGFQMILVALVSIYVLEHLITRWSSLCLNRLQYSTILPIMASSLPMGSAAFPKSNLHLKFLRNGQATSSSIGFVVEETLFLSPHFPHNLIQSWGKFIPGLLNWIYNPDLFHENLHQVLLTGGFSTCAPSPPCHRKSHGPGCQVEDLRLAIHGLDGLEGNIASGAQFLGFENPLTVN